jgi:hypothetical protein
VVHGSEGSRIQNLSFENVHLRLNDGPLQSAYGGNFDLRAAKDATQRVFAHDIPALYCRHAEGLRIKGLRVAWDESIPAFFNHALQLEDVKDVVIDGFEGRQPHGTGATITLDRVAGISIRNCRAADGTDTFVDCVEVTDARLFTNNDLLDAKTVFRLPGTAFSMADNLLPKK